MAGGIQRVERRASLRSVLESRLPWDRDVSAAKGRRRLAADHEQELARGRRTAERVAEASDWVWPWWLQREADVRSPDFVPIDTLGLRTNTSHRSWTSLAITGGDTAGRVDPRGLVISHPGGWSLDWCVGSDERWHLPSREAGVRQELLDGTPVVKTLMRIPGGDAVHHVYAARPRGSDEDHLVIEVENQSRLPIALALVVRPVDLEGLTDIERIELDVSTISVNGQPALLFDSPPPLVATSNWVGGDVMDAVMKGTAGSDPSALVSCPEGMAQMALIVPLPHTATLRVSLPLSGGMAPPASLPAAAQVAAGWRAQVDRGMRVVVPDSRVADLVDTGRMQLLAQYRNATELAEVAAALDRQGFHGEAGDALLALGQRSESEMPRRRWDTASLCAALGAISRHSSLSRDHALTKALSGVVADLAVDLGNRASEPGARQGLLDAAEALEAAGESQAAAQARALAANAASATESSGAPATEAEAEPRSPMVRTGHGEDIRETARRATIEAGQGRGTAAESVDWLARVMGPTGAWPRSRHPRTGAGSQASGHDTVTGAAVLDAVRSLLIDEGPDSITLLPVVPKAWLGQSIEAHDVPTRLGTLGFAVRWHGERPALLWEFDPHDPDIVVNFSIPGLDRSWSTTELSGDTLLSEPEAPTAETDREAEIGAPPVTGSEGLGTGDSTIGTSESVSSVDLDVSDGGDFA